MFGLMPIALSIVGSVFWLIVKLTCRRKSKDFNLRLNVMVTTFVFVYIIYPQITSICFALFNCVSFEDGNSYLKRDINIQCWSGDHLKMSLGMGIPFIFVWAFLFPFLIFWNLKKSKGKLGDHQNLQKYGLYYVGLNDNTYFWELVIVNIRKIIFVFCGSILSSYNQEYKALIGVAILFA